MSGHSKWANIKHKKAKGDAAKGKIFTKIGRELAVAVKAGGSDPNTNSRLFDCIQKAKVNNMPNDNITRSIKKAAGEAGNVDYEEIIYEGYGVSGAAVIVETLTDNKNRTAGDVRCCFDKHGGSLGTSNCVSFMFERKGIIVAEREGGLNEDEIFELALEAGADDVRVEDDIFEVFTTPTTYSEVSKNLAEKKLAILSSEIEWVPNSLITLDTTSLGKFQRMIDALEDNDDVQSVYHNVDIPEDNDEE